IGDIYECSFLEKYLYIFSSENQEYDIIYWNRKEYREGEGSNIFVFNNTSDCNMMKILKMKEFLKFRIYINKILKQKKYDKLVILTTLTGVLLIDKLIFDYSSKYIFDIRDLSGEKWSLFKYLEKKIIENSFFTCISSKGFESKLPEYNNYVLSHNIRLNDLKNRVIIRNNNSNKEKINIVYIGAIRQFEHIVKFIEKIAPDKRFNLYYHGDGSDYVKLKEFCLEKQYDNVFVTGKYNNDEKKELLLKADIINNHYDLTMNTQYCTSNKFYDGLIYKIPQLVNLNTFDGKQIRKQELGLEIDLNWDDINDQIYDYYMNLDFNSFVNRCEILLDEILLEDENYINQIYCFVKK
ncbi:hypothetical protein, partial [Turicibacter sanguinis]|uniref:hypothetical protein n=1 Tax=Turicibacter sanguinis TaxID=154288 RepID=UPI00325B41E3